MAVSAKLISIDCAMKPRLARQVGFSFTSKPLVQDGARRQLQKLSYRFVDVREGGMRSKLLVLAVAGACVVLAGCNTVRGAAKDVESAANCTESTMKTGRC